MINFFNQLFKIQTREWPRLLILCLMLFLTNVGTIWGATITQAVIWKEVGLSLLPWIFVINGILAIPAIAVYTAFADRVTHTRLYVAIVGLSAGGIALGLFLLAVNQDVWGYGLLYIVAFVLMTDIFGLHWFTYVNGFYDTRAAKRVIPVLSTSSRLAGIFAGQAIPYLNAQFPTRDGHIVLWFIALVLAVLLAALMPYLLKERSFSHLQTRLQQQWQKEAETRPSYGQSIRDGYQYVTDSVFLRRMAITTLLLMILLPLVNYQAGYVFQEKMGDVDAISEYIGDITSLANMIMLPLQLVLLSRLIGRIGLAHANLIFPIGTFLMSGLLVTWRSQLAAGLSYFNRTSFNFSFRTPIDGLLYNAVPARIKGRARAFIGGFIIPIGSILGGILLLAGGGAEAAPSSFFVTWFLPGVIMGLALAYLIGAWGIGKPYAQALITMLEQEDYAFLFTQEVSDLTLTDPATLRSLEQKLAESDSPELTLFLAKLLCDVGGQAAVPALNTVIREAEGEAKAILIDVLVAAEMRGEEVCQLYIDCVPDAHPLVRQSAVMGLEQLVGTQSSLFLAQAQTLVLDASIQVRAQVLPSLLQAVDADSRALAAQTVTHLLASEHPPDRAMGIHVLAQVGDPAAIEQVIAHLSDTEDVVRLEAALAVEALTQKGITPSQEALILSQMARLHRDPVERVRQIAILVWGRLNTKAAHEILVKSLTDSSLVVRTTAVAAVMQADQSILSLVRARLTAADRQEQKMAAMVLSRLNPDEFETLMMPHITHNLAVIYENVAQLDLLRPYTHLSAIDILCQALKEKDQLLLDEIFYLLTAVHDPSDVEVVVNALSSEDARLRANAIEALESLTTPQTAALIGPLFEPALPLSHLLTRSQKVWGAAHQDAAAVIRHLWQETTDPWLRTLTVFALGDMGKQAASNGRPAPDPPASPTPPRRRRNRMDNLLQKLTEPEETSPDMASEQPPTSRHRPQAPSRSSDNKLLLTSAEIEVMLRQAATDPDDEVRAAAQAARRVTAGLPIMEVFLKEKKGLSIIEKIIFLKAVPFFQGMTVSQLKALAQVSEEQFFPEDTVIYHQRAAGGVLYVVVSGRVGIEQEGQRHGSFKRLQTVESYSYFGEMNLFDGSPHAVSARAIRDTLTLRLRREPLVILARQHPGLSLVLIRELSQRLREATAQVAALSDKSPSALQKLLDL